jgi:iron complex transport system ATP-binding protein
MLTITGLHYRYGPQPILKGIDLAIAPGEVVSLVGPNGAGKSTLLKCVNNILRFSQGQIAVAGRPVTAYGHRHLARMVAYVPQQAGPTLSLPVLDMVRLGRAPHRGQSTGRRDHAIVMEAIDRLNLQALALKPFGALSGGEQQRVLLARALAQGGRLMLLDEPTAALDIRHQLETMTLLRSIARDSGIAVLVAIHDLALAARFSDRLVMMHQGTIHAQGPWQAVLTAKNLEGVYGVGAVVGTDQGLPYVIQTQAADGR